MKRLILLILSLFLISSIPLFGHSDNDHDEPVYKTMQRIMVTMNRLKRAAKDRDFQIAKVELDKIAKDFKALDKITPRRGNKSEWDSIHEEIIKLAREGQRHCNRKDINGLNRVIKRIEEQQVKGHRKFN